jgi:hypothetical protein
LTPGEAARAEAHAVGCARCQAMLAVLAKSAPAEPALVPWWRRQWGLGLLVPLAAGTAAIAIWIASPAYQRPAAPASITAQNESAELKKEQPSPPPADRLSPPPTDSLSASPARQGPTDDRAKAAEKRDASRSEPIASTNTAMRDDRAAPSSPAAQGALGGAVGSPAAAPVSAPASARSAAAPAPAAAPEATADSGRRLFARQAGPATEVLSPAGAIRWRIGGGGSIQYSADGGGSWEAAVSGVSTDLLAGSSPSASVCWVVGRGGTVLRTADGRQWQRVVFPEPVDLIAVQATDARTATVRAADGRAFRSTDGGATWTPAQDF